MVWSYWMRLITCAGLLLFSLKQSATGSGVYACLNKTGADLVFAENTAVVKAPAAVRDPSEGYIIRVYYAEEFYSTL